MATSPCLVFAPFGRVPSTRVTKFLDVAEGLPGLESIRASCWAKTCLSRPSMQWRTLAAVAPPIGICCEARTFVDENSRRLGNVLTRMILFGLPPTVCDTEAASSLLESTLKGVPALGLLRSSLDYQTFSSTMQVPDAKRLIYDSAKLARLDLLLQELKAGDHRVLIYFQMTKMMDLMEEYLIYRQYKYLRLDGSSKLEDRRDMVIDWQTK